MSILSSDEKVCIISVLFIVCLLVIDFTALGKYISKLFNKKEHFDNNCIQLPNCSMPDSLNIKKKIEVIKQFIGNLLAIQNSQIKLLFDDYIYVFNSYLKHLENPPSNKNYEIIGSYKYLTNEYENIPNLICGIKQRRNFREQLTRDS